MSYTKNRTIFPMPLRKIIFKPPQGQPEEPPAEPFGVRDTVPFRFKDCQDSLHTIAEHLFGDKDAVWLLKLVQPTRPDGLVQASIGRKFLGKKPHREHKEINFEEMEQMAKEAGDKIKQGLTKAFADFQEGVQKGILKDEDIKKFDTMMAQLRQNAHPIIKHTIDAFQNAFGLSSTGEEKGIFALLVNRLPFLKGKVQEYIDKNKLEQEMKKARSLIEAGGAIDKALKKDTIDGKVLKNTQDIVRQALQTEDTKDLQKAVEKLFKPVVPKLDPTKAKPLGEKQKAAKGKKGLGGDAPHEKLPHENPTVQMPFPMFNTLFKKLDKLTKAKGQPKKQTQEGQIWE